MHLPNRSAGPAPGCPARHYAPGPLQPRYQGVPPARPPSGKSFTIEALLARPEDAPGCRTGTCRHVGPPAPYVFSPNLLRAQPAYAVYCCPPFSCQPSCRGAAFYAQASLSKVTAGLHAFRAKGGKSKRLRTSFSSEQLSRLEAEFARQQYMVGSERFLLASALQLTEAQVKVWFQNRRIKWRKQSLEQQQAKLAKLGLAAPPKSPGSQGHGDEGDEDEEFSDLDVDVDVDVSDDSTGPC